MSEERKIPGGTGVDEHGVLLRSKPDPNAPAPDPALIANDDANLLYFAAAAAGDPALMRRAWLQLKLVDSAGTPTPLMAEFIRAHQEWQTQRGQLAYGLMTPDKARAYLEAHLK